MMASGTLRHGAMLCLGALVATWSLGATNAAANVGVGDTPNFTISTLDNQVVRSSDLEGRIVVLDFWATWCGPCVRAKPHVINMNNQYAPQGVQLVSISLDRDRGSLNRFLQQNNMPWIQAMDGGRNSMANLFGVRGIPRTFILSPEGEVLWVGHPTNMERPLQEALRTHPPRPAEPSPAALREEALQQLGQVQRAIASDEYAQAFVLLAEVSERSMYDAEVSRRMKVIADRLAAEEAAEAREAHPELAQKLPAMQAQLHVSYGQYERARRMSRDGNVPMGFRGYLMVIQRAPNTELAAQAAEEAAELHSSAVHQPRLRNVRLDDQPAAAFAIAELHREAGRAALARQLYEVAAASDDESVSQLAREAMASLE